MLKIISGMYEGMKPCVRSKKSNRCFMRGSVNSRIIFFLCSSTDDFEMDFLTKNNLPVQLLELNLFLLMCRVVNFEFTG